MAFKAEEKAAEAEARAENAEKEVDKINTEKEWKIETWKQGFMDGISKRVSCERFNEGFMAGMAAMSSHEVNEGHERP